MINYSELLKTLSKQNNKIYTAKNTKLKVIENGQYSSGRSKYLVKVLDLSDNCLFEGDGLLTEKNQILVDDTSLYQATFVIEKKE